MDIKNLFRQAQIKSIIADTKVIVALMAGHFAFNRVENNVEKGEIACNGIISFFDNLLGSLLSRGSPQLGIILATKPPGHELDTLTTEPSRQSSFLVDAKYP